MMRLKLSVDTLASTFLEHVCKPRPYCGLSSWHPSFSKHQAAWCWFRSREAAIHPPESCRLEEPLASATFSSERLTAIIIKSSLHDHVDEASQTCPLLFLCNQHKLRSGQPNTSSYITTMRQECRSRSHERCQYANIAMRVFEVCLYNQVKSRGRPPPLPPSAPESSESTLPQSRV